MGHGVSFGFELPTQVRRKNKDAPNWGTRLSVRFGCAVEKVTEIQGWM